MKKLFLTIAALAILAGHPAAAADMRVPVYKALPPVYDPWAGGYVGINVGYSWGPWGASSNQPVFNFESLTASPKLNGWLGGVQAGHNWRVNGQWLLGIEGDVQITGEKAAQTWIDPELPPNLGETFAFVPRAGGPATLSHDWQLPWFATLRLRAGVTPIESWLLYVTGGLAVGGTRYSFSFSQPGAALNFPPTPTSYADRPGSASQPVSGARSGLISTGRSSSNTSFWISAACRSTPSTSTATASTWTTGCATISCASD